MRRNFRRRAVKTGPKRNLVWDNTWVFGNDSNFANGDVGAVWVRWPVGMKGAINPGAIDATGFVAEDNVPPVTLVRTVVNNWFVTNTLNGTGPEVGHVYGFAAGLVVWTAEPSYADFLHGYVGPAGDVGLPQPIDGGYDWVWRWSSMGGVITSTQFLFNPQISDRQQESKAQRKLDKSEGLLFLVQWFDTAELVGNTPTDDMSLNFGADIRFLMKET